MEGDREGEKHPCVVASHVPPTGDLAHNPGMCPDWELNRGPFALQAGTQYSEPHQPGLKYIFFKILIQNYAFLHHLTPPTPPAWPRDMKGHLSGASHAREEASLG